MPSFPKTEPEIVTLAQEISAGLKANPTLFADTPVSATELDALILAFQNLTAASIAAHSAKLAATTAKRGGMNNLRGGMKRILRYAESETHNNRLDLQRLGWNATHAPRELTPPGQPRLLRIVEEGDTSIRLAWKKPSTGSGGAVATYRIEQREFHADSGPTQWRLVEASLEPEAQVTALPQHIKQEFRVIATNRAGESLPSNVVAAVL